MSTVIAIERDPHATAQALLPWYARGQLDDEEMALVQTHLQDCPACRAELATERALQDLQRLQPQSAADADAVEAGLARLRARIGATRPVRPAASGEAVLPRWLGWALGLQTGAIAALLMLLAWPHAAETPAPYRGLAAPAPTPQARALIMFRPEAREQEIRAALRDSGASLIGGPTESQAYLLQLPREGRQQALQRLRARPEVSLVESLEAEPPR